MHPTIENFQHRTNQFLDAVALFPDRLRSVAPEGEWSAAFIVHHVSDAELHFAARYLHILSTDNPTMIYFDEDRYPEAIKYSTRTLTKSLASIAGIRSMVQEVLVNMDESALTRTTTAEDGTVFTFADLLDKADSHMRAHTEQLKELHAQIS